MKKLLIIIALMCIISVPNVLAANIHSCADALEGAIIDEKIPNTVSIIVTVIKIAVPVLLVIFGMMDLFKSIIAQKEDEIKKGRQIFIKRLISGALVFFVFTIVQLVITFVAGKNSRGDIVSCMQCFINGKCSYDKNADGTCPNGTYLSDNNAYCVEN